MVGGTEAALHAEHRFSYDDDHVVRDLVSRFAAVLDDLETRAGWVTKRITPPVQILGNLNGVATGIRNLIRVAPLEVQTYKTRDGTIVLPTLHEMLRVKAWLSLTRNATRDYIDTVALADKIEISEGQACVVRSLEMMDVLYPQRNGDSAVIQLAKQLAEPKPYDLATEDLSVYRHLAAKWGDWAVVERGATRLGAMLLLALEKRPAGESGSQ